MAAKKPKSKRVADKPTAAKRASKPEAKESAPAPGASSIDALFADIERNPGELATYLVLADALADLGDPRGELAHVQHALTTAKGASRQPLVAREAALVGEQRTLVLGALADRSDIELGFHFGFVSSVRVSHPALDPEQMGKALAAVFASPQSRLLRSVAILPSEFGPPELLDGDPLVVLDRGPDGAEHPIKTVLDHLVAAKVRVPPSITSLTLGNAFERSRGYRCYSDYDVVAFSDDLSTVLTVFDHLEELRVDLGCVKLAWAPLVSDRLARFTYVSPFVRNSELAPLAESAVPALESFVLWTGTQGLVNTEEDLEDGPDALLSIDEMGYDDEEGALELEPLFAMLDGCAQLRDAGIANYAGDVASLATAIGKHAFFKRLHAFDLSWCDLGAGDGTAVAKLLAKAPELRELRLVGGQVAPKVRAKLEKPGLTIVGEPATGTARYRYVVTQE